MNSVKDELDSILVEIGEYGKYQRLLTLLIVLVITINFFPNALYVFEATPINHRCKITECDLEPPEYNPKWLVNAVPIKNEKPARCTKFEHIDNSSCELHSFNSTMQEQCDDYIYDSPQTNIMHDFNLHCDENLKYLTLVGTISGIGKLIGLPIVGYISDRYGRKRILIWCALISGSLGIARSFSSSYVFFLIFEFIDAIFCAAVYTTTYVLASELVGPKTRALFGTLQLLSYSIGSVILGFSAWFIHSWRNLLRVLYAPYVLIIAYHWLLPESVRWLIVQHRPEEAITILRKIAKVNGKKISKEKIENLVNGNDKLDYMTISMKDLFKSSKLMIRCFLCSVCWISFVSVYYGLTIVSTTLSGNRYLDFILTCSIEVPANFLGLFILNRKGRKISLAISLLLSSVSSITYILIPTDLHWIKLSIYLLSKFGITMAIPGFYLLTNEMFPTPLRQTLLSICSMIGRIGNMIAPQLILLLEIWKHLPLVVFAVLTLVSAIIVLFALPETKGVALPDTIEDAENIGNQKPLNEISVRKTSL